MYFLFRIGRCFLSSKELGIFDPLGQGRRRFFRGHGVEVCPAGKGEMTYVLCNADEGAPCLMPNVTLDRWSLPSF